MNQWFLLFFSFLFFACSSNKEGTEVKKTYKITPYFNKNILSEKKIISGNQNNSTAVLLITNDLFNNFEGVEKEYINRQTKKKKSLIIGGKEKLKKYKRLIENKFKYPTVFIDSGNFTNPRVIPSKAAAFFNDLDYQVVALGKNEFKINFPYNQYYKDQLYKLLSPVDDKITLSNLTTPFESRNNFKFTNLSKPKIIKVGNLKIGIITVIQPDFSLEINPKKLNGFIFQHFNQSIKSQLDILAVNKTNFNVLIANTDLQCPLIKGRFIKKTQSFDPNKNLPCVTDSYLYKQVSLISKGNIHLILGSGAGGMLHHKIAGIPFVQNSIGGDYISAIQVSYNEKKSKPELKIFKPISLK
ncbi:hypothetical protein N9N67_05365 [Bacteriovoracaceae bacterium]|nr:hypothetical protein [Bacteriovoracaceae bacterium]